MCNTSVMYTLKSAYVPLSVDESLFNNIDLNAKSVELKGLYHRRVFAVCLQSDPESCEWGLPERLVNVKWNP